MARTFKEIITSIRTAVFGSEVRESIAQGMECVEQIGTDSAAAADRAEAAAETSQQASSEAAASADEALATANSIRQIAGGSLIGSFLLTLSADPGSWTQTGEDSAYPLQCRAALESCKAEYLPSATIAADSIAAADTCELAPVCETLDGSVRFWAKTQPTTPIQVQVALLGKAESTEQEVE